MPSLLSVNVGMPRDVSWQGRTVHTGVWKEPVSGPVMVRRLNIDGDGQGDRAGHGGEQRAVLVYQVQSYRYWQEHFRRNDFVHGEFGENLTVDGLGDAEVCIGDRYAIGEAEFEVTQPRVTCYRVGMRVGEPELPALLVSHHRPGFYMRVIREGHIQAGDPITKTRTGPGPLSVADADALLYLPHRDPDELRLALSIPALSPGWRNSFHDLLADADRGTAAPGPTWTGFRPLHVDEVVAENSFVTSLYLSSPDGTPLPEVRAGQYLTLRLPSVAQPAPVRSYSLSSTPVDGRYRISVKHEPHGTVSGYLTTRAHPGELLDAAAPRGEFVLTDGSEPVVLVSAGIGLTPVLAILHELAAHHREREVWWIHGARRPEEHPLTTEAHDLVTSLPHGHEHIYYSLAAPRDRHGGGFSYGRLTADILTALSLPADAIAYLCGPAVFMADMRQALESAGIEADRIHVEAFSPLPSTNPGVTPRSAVSPHQPAGAPGTGPQVSFARSGISTPFPDDRRSLLELAEACDVPTRWSCRTGVCHTCATPLLSGTVTYEPEPLESPPPGEALICCARPDDDIVLDM
ncbi:MOSC and FAD-binding oxidoreductase domain-containing protein [Streptomyces edwardsiae]|uniref:MOSC and FAD-binding oxidoreductase domain-containing protein n=1 Tax=Streptomyces edwardsiae TaxID=3075527 RepID=A0ABU2QB29_9ACTN|nr:MOSC and FAD-binding oxidoreductase domain-containing protein [Streptomyces sp. DSM 41635]MDT0401251.1 MOSC and FAD-binding oxidoreductase domain-containing protein [Streptomyces sp. DSM 41635]